ncbi:c-type cytochrome [Pontibacter sp. HJ8]
MLPLLRRLFGSPTGQLGIYCSLFAAFLAFSGYVYVAEVPAVPVGANQELAVQGKQLWQQHNCSSCHQLYGLGDYLGPDLTNVVSDKGIPYAKAIMQGGTGTMPDFKLSDQEITALLAFLEHADHTGKAGRQHFGVDAFGQIYSKATDHE